MLFLTVRTPNSSHKTEVGKHLQMLSILAEEKEHLVFILGNLCTYHILGLHPYKGRIQKFLEQYIYLLFLIGYIVFRLFLVFCVSILNNIYRHKHLIDIEKGIYASIFYNIYLLYLF